MEKEFDFDKIGKRMPYQTPDGFFDEMEENIWNEVKGDLLGTADSADLQDKADDAGLQNQPGKAEQIALKPKRKNSRLRILVWALSIAASIALILILYPRHSQTPRQQVDGLAQVEKAFSNLAPEDQAYMLQVYQEDVFINE